jgi:hypothetical protein
MMSAADLPPLRRLDGRESAVLARTPAAARRVRYLALDPAPFAAAIRARNPKAEVLTDPADRAAVEALATDDLDLLLARSDAAQVLAAADVVTAAIAPAGPAALAARLQALADHGLEIGHLHDADTPLGYFDDRAANLAPAWREGRLPDDATVGTLIVVARRAGAAPLLHLRMITFAPTLMDIRTRLPAEAMRSEAGLLVTHEKVPAPMPMLPRDEPKVSVLQRPAAMDAKAWRDAIAARAQAGWIVVMEYDDHPELVARVRGRTTGPADYVRFAHVHAVQTSTPPLVQLFKQHNPEVRMLPNAAFRLEPFPERLPRRVFYGAVSRGPFAAQVAASLGPVVEEFPDTEFVVIADRAVFDALPTQRKVFHDYMSFDTYLDLMATCAVSLSPVEGSEHQETKSDAKFLDASARGVLTIASPTIYAGVMRQGRNGLIAQALGDWALLLAQALRDEAASRTMARNAYDYVAGARMFADQIAERTAWYRELWDRRAELNAALFKRFETVG